MYTFFNGPWMMLTLPFAFFGVLRYHYLAHSPDLPAKPEDLFRDGPSVTCGFLWIAATITALYDVPPRLLNMIS
jgi:hypothetical protein